MLFMTQAEGENFKLWIVPSVIYTDIVPASLLSSGTILNGCLMTMVLQGFNVSAAETNL